MTVRNLSPQQMFIDMARDHVPQYRFTGRTRRQFQTWARRARPAVLNTLGEFPDPVPPKPELLAEWEQDGLRRQRWIIDVQKHLSAVLLVNYPGDWKRGQKRPAVLCCHGHGPHGMALSRARGRPVGGGARSGRSLSFARDSRVPCAR